MCIYEPAEAPSRSVGSRSGGENPKRHGPVVLSLRIPLDHSRNGVNWRNRLHGIADAWAIQPSCPDRGKHDVRGIIGVGGGVVRVSSETGEEFRLKCRRYVAKRRIQHAVELRIGIGSGDRRADQEDASEPGFANGLDEGRALVWWRRPLWHLTPPCQV